MRPIIIVMLCVEVALFLAAAYVVVVRKPTEERPGPVWTSLASSLLVGGIGANMVAENHSGQSGADILSFAGAMLFGMAIMCALVAFRQRRGM
jgi:drug/metabolite transporter (DMT)-like permease